MQQNQYCECQYCKDQIDFELDPFLIKEICSCNAVIFAGAGVSTENPNSAPNSLYNELAAEIGIKKSKPAFPDLTQQYCQRPDGRFELLKRIQDRFDSILKFSDLRMQARKFYQELSTMPYFRTFITTNWDRHFEDICHAKPFVYDADMRFWEVPDRRVLKIHGTIDNYSSMVITREDYNECLTELQNSLIGSKLKDLLTMRTCIFVGYSMNDEDFQSIFEFVKAGQGKFKKMHYLVAPDADDYTSHENISIIRTDGTYFLKIIKEHLCSTKGYLNDNIFDQAEEYLFEVQQEHTTLWEQYNPSEYPQMLPSAMYQDGLMHAYKLVRDMKGTGNYSDPNVIQIKIQGYQEKIAYYRSLRKYLDTAYFSGYQNVLIALALSRDSNPMPYPPLYYFEKLGEMDRDEFEENFEKLPEIHKTAFRQCVKLASSIPSDGSIVIQHSPWG